MECLCPPLPKATEEIETYTLAGFRAFVFASAQGCFFCSVAASIVYIPVALFCGFLEALRPFVYALVSTRPLAQPTYR